MKKNKRNAHFEYCLAYHFGSFSFRQRFFFGPKRKGLCQGMRSDNKAGIHNFIEEQNTHT